MNLKKLWRNMIRRCHEPSDPSYASYGARGIRVCDRWRASYEAFATDMGERPSMLHVLDRLDKAKGYAPDNVRWATRAEQAITRAGTTFIDFNGSELTVSEWARQAGIHPATLWSRLARGWSMERALAGAIDTSSRPQRAQRLSDPRPLEATLALTHDRGKTGGIKQTLNSRSMGAAAVQRYCTQGDEMQIVPGWACPDLNGGPHAYQSGHANAADVSTRTQTTGSLPTHRNSANSDDEGSKPAPSAGAVSGSAAPDADKSAFAKAPIGFNNRSTENDRSQPFVIRLAGELVLNNRSQLRGFIADALEAGKRTVAIDCAACGYIDASGLGVLVSCARKLAAAGGTLALCNLNEDIWTLLGMTALEPFFLRGTLPDSATPDAIVAAVVR